MINRVRAILIKEGSVCLIHRIKQDREYWVFPGGGIEDGDPSPEAALTRECLEELGLEIAIISVFATDNLTTPNGLQSETFYLCEPIQEKGKALSGPEDQRDPKIFGSYAIEWVPLKAARTMNVQPQKIRDLLIEESG